MRYLFFLHPFFRNCMKFFSTIIAASAVVKFAQATTTRRPKQDEFQTRSFTTPDPEKYIFGTIPWFHGGGIGFIAERYNTTTTTTIWVDFVVSISIVLVAFLPSINQTTNATWTVVSSRLDLDVEVHRRDFTNRGIIWRINRCSINFFNRVVFCVFDIFSERPSVA